MRADRGHEDGGHVRVHHGSAGRDRVRGGPRRGRQHDAVSLDGGDELPAVVRLDLGQERGRAAVHENLVEDGERVRGCPAAAVSLRIPRLDQSALQPHAQRDRDAALDVRNLLRPLAHGLEQRLSHALGRVVREEAHRSEVETQHGRNRTLEQLGRVEDDAVAAEADDEVERAPVLLGYPARHLVHLERLARGVHVLADLLGVLALVVRSGKIPRSPSGTVRAFVHLASVFPLDPHLLQHARLDDNLEAHGQHCVGNLHQVLQQRRAELLEDEDPLGGLAPHQHQLLGGRVRNLEHALLNLLARASEPVRADDVHVGRLIQVRVLPNRHGFVRPNTSGPGPLGPEGSRRDPVRGYVVKVVLVEPRALVEGSAPTRPGLGFVGGLLEDRLAVVAEIDGGGRLHHPVYRVPALPPSRLALLRDVRQPRLRPLPPGPLGNLLALRGPRVLLLPLHLLRRLSLLREPVRERTHESLLRDGAKVAVEGFQRERLLDVHAARDAPAAHHATRAADARLAVHQHGAFGLVVGDLDEPLHGLEGRGFHVRHRDVHNLQLRLDVTNLAPLAVDPAEGPRPLVIPVLEPQVDDRLEAPGHHPRPALRGGLTASVERNLGRLRATQRVGAVERSGPI